MNSVNMQNRPTKKGHRFFKTGHREDLHPFIPDVQIIKIRDYRPRESVLMPTVIMGEIALLGVLFLQNCTLHLDGRKRSGYLELNPKW
jgi:hypothetical protein